MTIKAHQVADVFKAVPGLKIEILNANFPTLTTNTGPGTWAVIGEAGEEAQAAFDVAVAGLYRVQLTQSFYSDAIDTEAEFRLNFDSGALFAGTVSDNWRHFVNPADQHVQVTFSAYVVLEPGAHTVDVEWQVISGAGNLRCGSTAYSIVTAEHVSGSGAGGTLGDYAVATVPGQVISAVAPGAWDDITGMSLTVNTVEQEQLVILARVWSYGSSWGTHVTKIDIDGGAIELLLGQTSTPGNETKNLSGSALSPPLAAGPHTIKIKAAKYGVENNWQINEGELEILRLRGGLVDVQENGINKVSSPRALNFIGADVVDVAGVATMTVAVGDSHAARHENGGPDEVSAAGLSGVLADPQKADTIVASGPVDLAVGGIAEGQVPIRSGTDLIGYTPTTLAHTHPESEVTFDTAGHDHSGGVQGNTVKYSDLEGAPVSAFGHLYMEDNPTETVISTVDVPEKVLGTTVAGELQNFTHADNRLTHTGTDTKKFLVVASMTLSGAVNNEQAGAVIYKNGVKVGAIIRGNSHPTNWEAVTVNVIVELATSDYVEVYVANHETTNNLTPLDMNLTVTEA